MTARDLIGTYSVNGKNQDSKNTPYTGYLTLGLDENNKITAEWTIGNSQKQFGTGFFKNNILVINFHYFDDNLLKYNGTVVYHFLTKTILDGFWSEELGEPGCLGEEQCFKLNQLNDLH